MKLSMFALLAVAGTATTAVADDLLLVDLSVTNQITITSTAGLSAATVSSTDNVGVYFADFFGTNSLGSAGATLVSGDLRPVGVTSDGTPALFHFSTDPGLNFFSWTNDPTSSFTTGSQAFTGSATYNLTPTAYAAYTAINPVGRVGDLFFPADQVGDLPQPLIGTWRIVPTPGAMAMLGLGGLAAARRRR